MRAYLHTIGDIREIFLSSSRVSSLVHRRCCCFGEETKTISLSLYAIRSNELCEARRAWNFHWVHGKGKTMRTMVGCSLVALGDIFEYVTFDRIGWYI